MKRLLAILGVLFIVTAACSDEEGGDGKPARSEAQQLVDQAKAALTEATTVRVQGEIPTDDDVIKLDVTAGKDGGEGTMTLGGFDVDVLWVEETPYFRGPADFWVARGGGKINSQTAVALSKAWVKSSADSSLGSLGSFLQTSTFAEQAFADVPDSIELGEKKDFDGREGVAVLNPEKEGGGVLYIATDDTHQPLALVPKEGDGGLSFTDYDKADPVEAPPANEVVELPSD